jgi:hypothetical protein
MKTQFEIAQVNIGKIRAPLDDPMLSGFVARLEDINALADSSPGFVWRLQTDAGNATSFRPYDDDRILVNMSVWATPEDLRDFVYRSAHSEVMRQRKSWFERFDGMYYALWWVPVGHLPTIDEAKDRLDYLRGHGESAHAFTFAKLYPAPEVPARPSEGHCAPPPGAANEVSVGVVHPAVQGPVAGFADPCPAA